MALEYWVMKRVAALSPTDPEFAKHVGRINRDELLFLNGFMLEPVEQYATQGEAYSAAVEAHAASKTPHHVVINADL